MVKKKCRGHIVDIKIIEGKKVINITSEFYTTLGELMLQSLFEGMRIVWESASPILIPMFIAAMIGAIIKKFILNRYYDFCILSGDTKRAARKKTKRVKNIIELISTTKDINDTMKR